MTAHADKRTKPWRTTESCALGGWNRPDNRHMVEVRFTGENRHSATVPIVFLPPKKEILLIYSRTGCMCYLMCLEWLDTIFYAPQEVRWINNHFLFFCVQNWKSRVLVIICNTSFSENAFPWKQTCRTSCHRLMHASKKNRFLKITTRKMIWLVFSMWHVTSDSHF